MKNQYRKPQHTLLQTLRAHVAYRNASALLRAAYSWSKVRPVSDFIHKPTPKVLRHFATSY